MQTVPHATLACQGEVLQMRPTADGSGAFEYYVRKNYYKTGSLMANSCKAAAVLGNHEPEVRCIPLILYYVLRL